MNESFVSIKMFIKRYIPFDFSPALFEFNGLTHLNTMTIIVFDFKFIEDIIWFNKKLNKNYIIYKIIHSIVSKIYKNFGKENFLTLIFIFSIYFRFISNFLQ